jgi:beta-glucosidase
MRKTFIITLLLLAPLCAICGEQPAYRNAKLSPTERANDLLGRMTLDEKIAQLQCVWIKNKVRWMENGKLSTSKLQELWPNGLGALARPNEKLNITSRAEFGSVLGAREAAEQYNTIQRYFVEHTRLGIPVMPHDETVHGDMGGDATVFPIPAAYSCSWDEQLVSDIFSVAAREARSKGACHGFGPVLDVVHDPRWGRVSEEMGEDPYLISRLGIAAVKGLQGDGDYIGADKMGATLKHFGVHGSSEGGNNTAPSFMDEHTARQLMLYPFREVIKATQPMFVMATYNQLWGKPAHANSHLLRDILRDEYGFRGAVTSDYGGVSNLHNTDGMFATMREAAVAAMKAGVNMEFPDPEAYPLLKEAVERGEISMDIIDQAVKEVLVQKFRMGLFDHPYVDVKQAARSCSMPQAKALAYKAAAESMVLLKNDNNFLPLDSNQVKTIALIGPNADRCILGGYSGVPEDTVTPLAAMRKMFGQKMNILYAEGVRLTNINSFNQPGVKIYSYEDNKQRIAKAVEVARQADIVVLFVGDNESISREGTSEQTPGDMPTLDLQAGQLQLIEEIAALGKPTCAMVNNSTTLNVEPLERLFPGVMMCWYLGQEGGTAMVDALFGKVNPSGKLSISIPRGAGYVPCYYNYMPGARRGYNGGYSNRPLHPFGYGLSYTQFSYGTPTIDKTEMGANDAATVSVEVENTGKRAGTEIVQLYIIDKYASMPRPVKELKGFKRIGLQPGEKTRVEFKIDKESLAFYDADYRWLVEPGEFEVAVGPSSDDCKTLKLTVK